MVMQWHPDRCREPNAQDQFMAIQHAWDILKDDAQRERYNAGLALEMSLKNNQTVNRRDELKIKSTATAPRSAAG